VDPITARAALGLAPSAVVTPELVDAAYRDAVDARHPARYHDAADRAAAEAWAATLVTARAALIAESTGFHAAPPATPRRMGAGAIVAISVAATLVVGGAGAAAGFAAASISRQATANISSASGEEPEAEQPPVEHLSADETGFSFPAAIEAYFDGRYDDECPAEFELGCWQTAIITDADCASLEVELAFSSSESGGPERTERRTLGSIARGLPEPVIFGDDDHEYGWIDDVVCVTTES